MISQRVLVVDDDPLHLRLIDIRLKEAGYEFILTASGEEAIEAARRAAENEGTFSVAVIDGLNGKGGQVADSLKETLPGIKIVAYSAIKQSFGDKNILKGDPINELLEAIATMIAA